METRIMRVSPYAGRGHRSQRGAGLAEVLVALVLVGMAITALLASFNTGSEAVIMTDEKVNARMLAENQIDLIKSDPYISATRSYIYPPLRGTQTGALTPYTLAGSPPGNLPAGYEMEVVVGTISSTVMPEDGTFLDAEAPLNADAIQQITVTVLRNNDIKARLDTFKANR